MIPVSLNSKISDSLIRDQEINKRSGDQSLPILKTDWCLTLMIKSYHQEYTSWVETISKKKKKKKKGNPTGNDDLNPYMYAFLLCGRATLLACPKSQRDH